MALKQVEIIREKKEKRTWTDLLLSPFRKQQYKSAFKKIELREKQIPPHTGIKGWLYFEVKDAGNEPAFFLKSLEGYELEIACVKNTGTNMVMNFYLPLDPFIHSFIVKQP